MTNRNLTTPFNLMYVHDVLILVWGNVKSCSNISKALDLFVEFFNLEDNKSKSKVLSKV